MVQVKLRPSPTEPSAEKALDLFDLRDIGVLGVLVAAPVAVLFKQK